MNETRREIALAATIVGGLVIGTVAAGQAAGGPAPITFLTDQQGSLSYAWLADGEVAAPGLAWGAPLRWACVGGCALVAAGGLWWFRRPGRDRARVGAAVLTLSGILTALLLGVSTLAETSRQQGLVGRAIAEEAVVSAEVTLTADARRHGVTVRRPDIHASGSDAGLEAVDADASSPAGGRGGPIAAPTGRFSVTCSYISTSCPSCRNAMPAEVPPIPAPMITAFTGTQARCPRAAARGEYAGHLAA